MPAVLSVPTLSQVKAWDSEHLTTAATQWTNTATVWEDAFTHVSTQVPCPGGLPWEGEAAGAAQQRAYSDRLIVIGVADQLHEASSIARVGASEIQAAKRSALAAISAAQNSGFSVEEDFSVTDRQRVSAAMMAARQAQAQSLAADIRTRVAELIATDQQVAAPASPGPAILPELGHDLAEAGKVAGAGVLAGIAIIGGMIAGGVTPSGQIAR